MSGSDRCKVRPSASTSLAGWPLRHAHSVALGSRFSALIPAGPPTPSRDTDSEASANATGLAEGFADAAPLSPPSRGFLDGLVAALADAIVLQSNAARTHWELVLTLRPEVLPATVLRMVGQPCSLDIEFTSTQRATVQRLQALQYELAARVTAMLPSDVVLSIRVALAEAPVAPDAILARRRLL